MRSTFGWLFRRRQLRSSREPMPEVGQPPADAEPIVEPRMQDIGFGSYELPLSDSPTADEPSGESKSD
jgi:hypothetical protein